MNNLFGNAKTGFSKLKGMFFKGKTEEQNKELNQNESKTENIKKIDKKKQKKQKEKTKKTEKEKEEENQNKMTIKTKENLSGFDFDEEDDDYEYEDTSNSNNNLNEDNTNSNNENKNYINFDYNEKEEDIFLICHRVYQKRSMLDIENMPYIPFIKVKKLKVFFLLLD